MVQACFCETDMGRRRHGLGERLPRHGHRVPFAAVVLGGGYMEAGDRGRFEVGAGDVVLHGAYESHLDAFASTGAEVLILPWGVAPIAATLGSVADPDGLVRLAEKDMREAVHGLVEQLEPLCRDPGDWPDRLAQALRADPSLRIDRWARANGLRPETVSRGFRLAYGIAPREFRARTRVLGALAMIPRGSPLAGVAADCGFADQAHLSRSFRAVTGAAPGRWSRAVRSL